MALFSSIFLLLLGNSLLSTLLILKGVEQGFSGKFFGVLTSVYFLGALIATVMASTLIKRMGHIKCFTFCTALLGCSILAYIVHVSPLSWLIIRFLTGFAVFAIYTVIESWLNGQTQDEYRSRVFSIYTLVNFVSVAASQQLLLLDSSIGYSLFILASLLVTAAIMPVSWTRLQQPNIAIDMPSMSVKSVVDAAPIAALGCFVSGLIMGPFWGLTPLFITELNYTNNELAAFISLSILGGALIQYPVGRWSDYMDRRKVILFAFVVAAILAFCMSLSAVHYPQQHTLMTTLSAVFCGLIIAVYPISVVHLVDRIHKDHLVAGSSGLLMIYGLGSFIGPVLAGFALEYLGAGALPRYYTAVLILFSVVLSVQLIRSKIVEVPSEHESEFVAMARTSPNVLPMHPESEEVLDAR